MRTTDHRRVRRLLRYQAYMLLPVALGAWVFGREAAWAALLGGAIALVANLLFALLVLAPYRAAEPGSLVARFYVGEVLKLLFVGLSFAAIFIWVRPLNVAALFVAFFMIQVVSPLLAHLSAEDT